MAAYWPTAQGAVADLMNGTDKVVCSRTLERVDWEHTTILRDAVADIARLKQQPGRTMFIIGSADLSASLTEHRLIDEPALLRADRARRRQPAVQEQS